MLLNKTKCFDTRGNKWEFYEEEFQDRYSVYGIHIEESTILLAQCAFNNLWCLPGGGKKENESNLHGLKREFLEESGLIINDEIKFIKTETSKIVMDKKPYNNISSYYYVNVIGGNIKIKGNNDDTLASKYFKFSDLMNLPIAEYQKEIILNICNKKSYEK